MCLCHGIGIGIGIGKGIGAAYLEEAGVLLREHQGVHCDSELLRTAHAKHTQKRREDVHYIMFNADSSRFPQEKNGR
jgi:hypothetical protein